MTCVTPNEGCDFEAALVSPGNISLRPVEAANSDWFPEAEELLAIDAMAGPGAPTNLYFDEAVVELQILSPTGAKFAVPSDQAPYLPYATYEMKVTAASEWEDFTAECQFVRVTLRALPPATQIELNKDNSTSLWIGLKGRGEALLNVNVSAAARGHITSELRSCDWTFQGLTPQSALGGLIHVHEHCA